MPNKDEQSHNGYIVDKEKDKRLTRIKEKKMSAQKQIFSDLPFYKSIDSIYGNTECCDP